jgi:formylglycine-generating enzyme required for sulfatase activity
MRINSLLLVATCALSWCPAAETKPVKPVTQPPAAAIAITAPAKPVWAASVAQDEFGYYADLVVAGVTQRMRWIPPGRFIMGVDKEGWSHPAHPVIITKGFWLGDTEITRGMWQAVVGDDDIKGAIIDMRKKDKMDRPATEVSWVAWTQFHTLLNQKVPGLQCTFPTEAQWEYACRAGTTTMFGNTENKNIAGWWRESLSKANMESLIQPVKQLKPNPWGLYDMHGNAAEFCSDWFAFPYPAGEQVDPTGPATGKAHVGRGGNYGSSDTDDVSSWGRAGGIDCESRRGSPRVGTRLYAPGAP